MYLVPSYYPCFIERCSSYKCLLQTPSIKSSSSRFIELNFYCIVERGFPLFSTFSGARRPVEKCPKFRVPGSFFQPCQIRGESVLQLLCLLHCLFIRNGFGTFSSFFDRTKNLKCCYRLSATSYNGTNGKDTVFMKYVYVIVVVV